MQGLRLDQKIIYRGTFGTGLFQCIYQPGPAHCAMLPGTLEWHLAAGLVGLFGFLWPVAWLVVTGTLSLSLTVAALQADQARLAPRHESFVARLLVMALCYAQPLVRSWARYRTRLLAYRHPTSEPTFPPARGLPLSGRRTVVYWSEAGRERTELLGLVIAYLNEQGWGKTIDSGWEDWDVEVYCHPWTVVQIRTAQEDHGSGKRLIRVRHDLHLSDTTKTLGVAAVLATGATLVLGGWLGAVAAAGACVLALAGLWWRGTRRAAAAVAVVDGFAARLGLIPCPS